MSDSTSNTSSGGIGFCGLLTIVFITLKLTNYIDWSWWYVLMPLWLPFVILLSIVTIFLLAVGVVQLLARRPRRRR